MADKQKLVENFAKDWNKGVLPLNQFEVSDNKIVEAEGKNHNVGYGYEVPVWRLDEKNLNERIYSTQLAEKVIKENKKTFNLKDHPEDEGSIDRIVGVSENPHIKEGILYVDAYIVDEEFERKLNKIIERGMGLGVSSSAYGDVDDNGHVMTEGFELERFFDFVLSPSYQVYLTKESRKENIEEEQDKENSELFEKNTTNNNIEEEEKANNKKEEKSMSDKDKKKMSIEEKNLKLGVKHLFNEAESTEDLKEKRKKYEEILDYCDGVEFASDYIQEANDQIHSIDEQLYELADKGKEVDSLKENTEKEKTELQTTLEEKENKIKSLTEEKESIIEKYDKAAEMLDELRLRERKINEMYKVVLAEKNGMVTASEYNELYRYCEKVEAELEEKKKELRKFKLKAESVKRKTYNRPSLKKVEEKVEEETPQVVENDYSEYSDSPNFDAIREWYERKLETEPRIKEIRHEILSKRTLMEAQRAYLRLKDLIEDTPSPYKSQYYGSSINEKEEDKKQATYYKPLKIKEGWM